MSNKKSILWVEDDLSYQQVMKESFSGVFTLSFVTNAHQAEEELQESIYDLLIVDLHLAGKKNAGKELVEKVNKLYPALPIIIVSQGKVKEMTAAQAKGAKAILSKAEINIEEWVDEFNKHTRPAVFLSHSSSDKPLVRIIKKELEDDWIEVWLDEVEILPGDVTVSRIAEGINSASVVLVFVSRRAVEDSKWVQDEVEHAKTLNTEGGGYPRIIPVVLEKEVAIPPLLKKFSELYLYDINEEFHNLTDGISIKYSPDEDDYTISLKRLKENLRPAIKRLLRAVNA